MRYHLRSSDRLSLRLTGFHPRLLSPRRLLRATGSEKMATMASVGGIRGASPRPTSRRRAASAADPYATKIANPRASSATARFESRRKPPRLTLIPPSSRTNHPRSLRRFQAPVFERPRFSRARVRRPPLPRHHHRGGDPLQEGQGAQALQGGDHQGELRLPPPPPDRAARHGGHFHLRGCRPAVQVPRRVPAG